MPKNNKPEPREECPRGCPFKIDPCPVHQVPQHPHGFRKLDRMVRERPNGGDR